MTEFLFLDEFLFFFRLSYQMHNIPHIPAVHYIGAAVHIKSSVVCL